MIRHRSASKRWTLHGQLSAASRWHHADQQMFWIVTGFTSLWLLLTIAADLWIEVQQNRGALHLSVTLFMGLLVAVWATVTFVLRARLPYWVGILGLCVAALILMRNILFADDVILVSTSLQMLPVFALYLGWFWKVRYTLWVFICTLVAIVSAIVWSPMVGPDSTLTLFIAMFTMAATGLAFVLASVLRTQLVGRANTDALTGAMNARALRTQGPAELRRAARRGEFLVMVAIDFDEFKKLNDTHGHAHGDTVLATTVHEWRTHLRTYDVIARVGGDEFVILLPNTTLVQAKNIMQRLAQATTSAWSWGASLAQPNDSFDTLFRRADEQLYRAKPNRSPAYTKANTTTSPPPRARLNLFTRSRRAHTDFSLMSALLGAVVVVPFCIGLFTGQAARASTGIFVVVCMLAVLGFVLTLFPLIAPRWYSPRMLYVNSVALMGSYIFMSFATEQLQNSVGLLHAVSIVALYLGLFSGSFVSRIFMLTAIALVSWPTLVHTFEPGHESDRPLVIITVLYAFIVSILLFDSGSFLYSRAKSNAEEDWLTGALNRYGLFAYAEPECVRAHRSHYPLVSVALDCINFKAVNDSRGHTAGDQTLIALTQHVKSALLPEELFARIGGDEFVLVLPYVDQDSAKARIELLRDTSPHPFRFGIAQLQPGETLVELLARADDDLTQQKLMGLHQPPVSNDAV